MGQDVRSLPCDGGDKVKFACVDGPEFDGHQSILMRR